MKSFLEMYPTIKKTKLIGTACSKSSKLLEKFEKKEVKSSFGLTYDIYFRDVQSALKTHLSCTNDNELILNARESLEQFYATSFHNALHEFQHATRLVKSFGDTEVSWKYSALDGMESAIRCLHIFSDRSLTTFLAGSAILSSSFNIAEIYRKRTSATQDKPGYNCGIPPDLVWTFKI